MPLFKIILSRQVEIDQHCKVTLSANSQEEAEKLALAGASNYSWCDDFEHVCMIEVDEVKQMKKK